MVWNGPCFAVTYGFCSSGTDLLEQSYTLNIPANIIRDSILSALFCHYLKECSYKEKR